jgi:hypothetical protein
MDVDCGARLPEHAATDGITGEDACEAVDGCRGTPHRTHVPQKFDNEWVTEINCSTGTAS